MFRRILLLAVLGSLAAGTMAAPAEAQALPTAQAIAPAGTLDATCRYHHRWHRHWHHHWRRHHRHYGWYHRGHHHRYWHHHHGVAAVRHVGGSTLQFH